MVNEQSIRANVLLVYELLDEFIVCLLVFILFIKDKVGLKTHTVFTFVIVQ